MTHHIHSPTSDQRVSELEFSPQKLSYLKKKKKKDLKQMNRTSMTSEPISSSVTYMYLEFQKAPREKLRQKNI